MGSKKRRSNIKSQKQLFKPKTRPSRFLDHKKSLPTFARKTSITQNMDSSITLSDRHILTTRTPLQKYSSMKFIDAFPKKQSCMELNPHKIFNRRKHNISIQSPLPKKIKMNKSMNSHDHWKFANTYSNNLFKKNSRNRKVIQEPLKPFKL